MTRIAGGLGLALAGGLAALLAALAASSPLDPVAWAPPPMPAPGAFDDPSRRLATVNRLETGGPVGPEDVAIWGGRPVSGLSDGTIVRWPDDGGPPEVVARTGGRPAGLDVDAGGRLLVADAHKGLLALDEHGHVEVLCTEAGGVPVRFADDVEVGPDDVAWFSDATQRHPFERWKDDLIENRDTGRLLRLDLSTGTCTVALSGLHFANGVAVDADNAFVLVVETSRYRVRRLWLAGPRAGQDDVFVDGLPGFPDGISRGEDGRFWLALASPRSRIVDLAAPWPWLRRVIAALPAGVQPAPARTAHAVALDRDGRVVEVLADPEGHTFRVVTSVQQHGDRLWLGSLADTAVGWVPAP